MTTQYTKRAEDPGQGMTVAEMLAIIEMLKTWDANLSAARPRVEIGIRGQIKALRVEVDSP